MKLQTSTRKGELVRCPDLKEKEREKVVSGKTTYRRDEKRKERGSSMNSGEGDTQGKARYLKRVRCIAKGKTGG